MDEKRKPDSAVDAKQEWLDNAKKLGWPMALVLLFTLAFAHFNSTRDVELSVANGTLKIKGSKEDLSKVLRLALNNSQTAQNDLASSGDQESHQRNLLLAVVDVIKNQHVSDELGKEIIALAKSGSKPFSWLEKRAIILPPDEELRYQAHICTDDKTFELWNKSVAYIWVDINDRTPQGPNSISPESAAKTERLVTGRFDCDFDKYTEKAGSKDVVVIKSDSKALFEASQRPEALAHALMRVRVPW